MRSQMHILNERFYDIYFWTLIVFQFYLSLIYLISFVIAFSLIMTS
jgi:hypothetical protein